MFSPQFVSSNVLYAHYYLWKSHHTDCIGKVSTVCGLRWLIRLMFWVKAFCMMAALIVSLQWPIVRCVIRLFTEKPYHIGCIHIVHSPVHILICVFRSFASVAALSKTDIAFHQFVFSDISEILITVMPLIWAFPYVYIL